MFVFYVAEVSEVSASGISAKFPLKINLEFNDLKPYW